MAALKSKWVERKKKTLIIHGQELRLQLLEKLTPKMRKKYEQKRAGGGGGRGFLQSCP